MIRLTSVVLPAPVGPTIATVWPGSTRNDRSVMSGRSGVYENLTCSNSMTPSPSTGFGASGESALLLFGIQQLEHPLGRCGARLDDRRHAAQLRQRLGELLRVLDERLHVAEAQLAARRP